MHLFNMPREPEILCVEWFFSLTITHLYKCVFVEMLTISSNPILCIFFVHIELLVYGFVLTAHYINREMAPLGARSISTQVGKGSCSLVASPTYINWKRFLITSIFLLWYAVRNRMKSVKNIQKITKAMKMVAASKLRAVQTRTENSRGLWEPFTALLGDAPSMYIYGVSKATALASCLVTFIYSVLLCIVRMMLCFFSMVWSVIHNVQ
jgi:hypothetical protein